MYRQTIIHSLLFLMILISFNNACSASLNNDAEKAFSSGKPFDLIVEYDDSAIEKAANDLRKKTANHNDDQKITNFKAKEYRSLKNRVDQSLSGRSDVTHIGSYNYLPISLKRVSSMAAINTLLAQPGVRGIYPNSKVRRATSENLALISQPQVAFVGEQGANTTVVVIDDGIDFQNTAFGDCSSPGIPSETCRVILSVDMINNPGSNNDHGTNVAAIVLQVAPSAQIAALNIFDSNGWGLESDAIAAIDWAIGNKSTYNIVAINMSFGDDTHNTSACSNDWSSAAIKRAIASGISVIAAAGNSGYTDGLPSPACAPGAISVGAVYDRSLVGARGYTTCYDKSSQADQIACFSNSASNLTLLAPGIMIDGAGINYSGTSQAAPHVAGAVAVLRSTYPNESLDEIQARMTSTGVKITDPRNNITTPRLNLLAAAKPTNDMFANRISLSAYAGSLSGTTVLASKEAGEPIVAGNVGGESLWWKWVAPQSGQLTVNPNGSGFDSLLAIYTGSQLSNLKPIASVDNTGNLASHQTNLIWEVTAGTEYVLSLDVANGAPSSFVLNWDLNTNPHANISTSITGDFNVGIGQTSYYTLSVTNNGPQAATNVITSVTAPNGSSIDSASKNCSINNNIMACNIALLPNGIVESFIFQITWNDIASSSILYSSISSDLPPNGSIFNGSIIKISSANILSTNQPSTLTTSSDSADIPALPDWGIMMFGVTILLISFRRSKK